MFLCFQTAKFLKTNAQNVVLGYENK